MRRRGLFKMRFISNRRGTAEVIGSILFIIILMFLFANVYLWHDAAVKDSNAMNLKQMNAGMDLSYASGELNVTAKGSDIYLYRVWLADYGGDHYYAEFEPSTRVAAGNTTRIALGELTFTNDAGVTFSGSIDTGDRLAVINTLGIKAELTVP